MIQVQLAPGQSAADVAAELLRKDPTIGGREIAFMRGDLLLFTDQGVRQLKTVAAWAARKRETRRKAHRRR